MRFLLDTSVLLWATSGTEYLDRGTLDLLEDRSNQVLFSTASIWEIAIKAGLKRKDFTADPLAVLADATTAGFQHLPVDARIAARVATLPHHHRDPFDRFLVAQAMAEPAVLLTPDRLLTRYTELVTVIRTA